VQLGRVADLLGFLVSQAEAARGHLGELGHAPLGAVARLVRSSHTLIGERIIAGVRPRAP